ncbi:hypothetical protein [Ramlibacter sp. WS9]|nr:hypothetical protein [Ramlibacter sp. WS9]
MVGCLPAIAELLAGMGWRSVVAFNDEDFGSRSLLGRSDKSESR